MKTEILVKLIFPPFHNTTVVFEIKKTDYDVINFNYNKYIWYL
jgi:hypothetical protein